MMCASPDVFGRTLMVINEDIVIFEGMGVSKNSFLGSVFVLLSLE